MALQCTRDVVTQSFSRFRKKALEYIANECARPRFEFQGIPKDVSALFAQIYQKRDAYFRVPTSANQEDAIFAELNALKNQMAEKFKQMYGAGKLTRAAQRLMYLATALGQIDYSLEDESWCEGGAWRECIKEFVERGSIDDVADDVSDCEVID